MISKLLNFIFMEYIGDLFTDVISGKMVSLYKDSEGVFWMKDSRFAFFKVKYARPAEEIETRWK